MMTILTLDCVAYLPMIEQDIAAHKEIELNYRDLKPEWQLSKQQMKAYVGFLTTVVSIIESRGFKIEKEYQSSESYSYYVRFSPINYYGEEYKLDVKFRLSDHPIKSLGHRSDNGGKDVVFDSFDIAGFECETIGQVISQIRTLCDELKSGDFSHFGISEEDALVVL